MRPPNAAATFGMTDRLDMRQGGSNTTQSGSHIDHRGLVVPVWTHVRTKTREHKPQYVEQSGRGAEGAAHAGYAGALPRGRAAPNRPKHGRRAICAGAGRSRGPRYSGVLLPHTARPSPARICPSPPPLRWSPVAAGARPRRCSSVCAPGRHALRSPLAYRYGISWYPSAWH